jgi:deoxyhypusine synthase
MTDAELESARISRVWDLLSSEEEYHEAEEWVGGFASQLDQSRPYSTREFLHLLGRELAEIAAEDGVLTAAYKSRVPVFCPGITDSGIAVGIRTSGIINLGGGIPKSFIRQTEMSAHIFKQQIHGHKYAIQIAADAPHPGGRSSAVAFEE